MNECQGDETDGLYDGNRFQCYNDGYHEFCKPCATKAEKCPYCGEDAYDSEEERKPNRMT